MKRILLVLMMLMMLMMLVPTVARAAHFPPEDFDLPFALPEMTPPQQPDEVGVLDLTWTVERWYGLLDHYYNFWQYNHRNRWGQEDAGTEGRESGYLEAEAWWRLGNNYTICTEAGTAINYNATSQTFVYMLYWKDGICYWLTTLYLPAAYDHHNFEFRFKINPLTRLLSYSIYDVTGSVYLVQGSVTLTFDAGYAYIPYGCLEYVSDQPTTAVGYLRWIELIDTNGRTHSSAGAISNQALMDNSPYISSTSDEFVNKWRMNFWYDD